MAELTKGGNAALPNAAVTVQLAWTSIPGGPAVDASALLLASNGKVWSDSDFVFFNQPAHPSGAVRHLGAVAGADSLAVDLPRVPAAVERIVVAASADGRAFAAVRGLRVLVRDEAGTVLLTFAVDAGVETALVVGELYRRAGAWKFRAVGQGYADGLAGLARDFGITVDDPGPAPTRSSEALPAAPRVDWLNPPVPAGYET